MSTGTDKMNAANELKNFANRFRSMLEVADDLEKLGSLENAIGEAGARLSALRDEQGVIEAAVDRARTSIDDANARAQEMTNLAADDADRVIALAKEEAAGLVSKANRDVGDIVSRGRAQADELASKIAAKHAELKIITTETAEAQSRLDAVNAELAALKAKF